MASRRKLKKSIKGAIDFIFYISVIVDQKNSDKIYDIIDKMSELVARISVTEPGNVKGYYKAIIKEYNECLKEVNAIITEEAA
jgi:hypothetical protein